MSNTIKNQEAPALRIPFYFWNAPRVFQRKGWEAKEAGIGVAIPKLEHYRDKPAIDVIVGKKERSYTVSPNDLLEKIEQRGCYNQNGRQLCGYVTENDLYSLAKASKGVKDSN